MKQRILLLLKFYFLKFLSTLGVWKEKKHSILLIRDDHLGDILMSLPAFQELRKYASFRGWKLILVVQGSLADLARSFALFDEVIPAENSSFRKRLAFYRKCAKLNVEISIDFLLFGKYLFQDYTSLIPSPRKSYVFDTRKSLPAMPAFQEISRNIFNDLYTDRFPYDTSLSIIENEALLISKILGKEIIPTAGDLSMLTLPPSQISKQPYYIIVPGSVDEKRMYPGEKFAFIINGIQKEFPFLTPVITGTEKEKPIAEKVIRMCDSPSNIIDLTGKSSLMELFANIAGAGFIISNDTGSIHIAAKYRKRTFCFSGHWHERSYIPPAKIYPSFTIFASPCKNPLCCGNCHRLKEGEPFPCLGEIPEKEALQTILQELEKEKELLS